MAMWDDQAHIFLDIVLLMCFFAHDHPVHLHEDVSVRVTAVPLSTFSIINTWETFKGGH